MLTTIIVALILLFEIIRLFLYIQESRQIRAMNMAAVLRAKQHEADYLAMRKSELDTLREMAKDSGRMAQMAEDFKRQMEGGKG